MYQRLSAIILTLLTFGCVQEEQPLSPIKNPILVTMEVTNVTSEGATLNASIEELGTNQNVKSYGFIWSENPKPIINTTYTSVFAFTSKIKRGMYSKLIASDLTLNWKYYVRAFVQTDDKIIYGNVVQFISNGGIPPVILNFTPKEGFDGTEVVLVGKNFSRSISGNRVLFGYSTATVLFASDTLLRVKSPQINELGYYSISIEVAGKQTFTTDKFKVLK
jgi:hypothetical protein